jgi:hypothetical protein
LIPHGNSSMEKLVAQQFYKFKQSHNWVKSVNK